MTITAKPTDLDTSGGTLDVLPLVADPWADGWSLPSSEELEAVGWPGARPEGAIPLRKVKPTAAQQYAQKMSAPGEATAVLDAPAPQPSEPPVGAPVEPIVAAPAPEQPSRDESEASAVVDLTETAQPKPKRARRPRRRRGRVRRLVERHRRLRLGVAAVATAYWYFALATLALAVVVPLVAGWSTTTVMSNSMEPVISQGDVVAFTDYDGSPLGEGTIIQFEDPVRPGETLTHRIVTVNPDGTYQTQGDANRGPDSTRVAPGSIIGVARMVSPFAGLPHFWLETGQYVWLGAWILLTATAATIMTPKGLVRREAAPDKEPEINTRPARLAPAADGPNTELRS